MMAIQCCTIGSIHTERLKKPFCQKLSLPAESKNTIHTCFLSVAFKDFAA